MLLNLISALSFVGLIAVVRCQSELGNICVLRATGQQGQCTLITSCPKAIEELTVQKRFPQQCGFQGTVPIVCCLPTATSSPPVVVRPVTEPFSPIPHRPATTNSRITGEISKEKCREYAKYIFKKGRPPILLINPEETIKNECGFKAIPLVVGGENATRKEFPHMALIGYSQTDSNIQWQCGASIISEQYVLTAGHCMFSRELGEAKFVQMGITNLRDRSFLQQFRIAQRIPHPDYKPPVHYNDIALVKLERPAQMTPYARPACLFRDYDIPTTKAIATGWGKLGYADEGSENLQKVTLQYIGVQQCNRSYQNQITTGRKLTDGIIDESQLCAGTPDDKERDTCQGDSGGPLQIYHTSDDIQCMYDIVGVTSFGKACGIGKAPGVYTRVSKYLKWIEDTVWP